MTEISLERIASALGYSEKPQHDSHRYANVSEVNQDGSFQVTFNGATRSTRAVNLCGASVGDRVMCVVHDGQVAAIGRVGGSMGAIPAVLYDNPSGYNGNITLEESVADYDYIRVYFFISRDGTVTYASTDLYEPNGKTVSLFGVRNATYNSRFHYGGATYSISNSTMTLVSSGVADSSGSVDGAWNTYIYRVEAWSGGASIGFGGGSGGGGGGGGGSQIDLLWTNTNPTGNFAAQTLSNIPWQNYKFLLIDHYTAGNGNVAAHYETSIISTDNPSDWSWITCIREVPFGRGVKFPASNQVQFGNQTYYSTYNGDNATLYDDWPFIVPTKIWGVKDGGASDPVADVLYTNDSGTTGTVTLSKSAANFDHMRIYFRKTNDVNQCASVDVYNPNGKYASLFVTNPRSANSDMWTAGRMVLISGTSITNSSGGYAEAQIGSGSSGNGDNRVAIYRVEAWNGTYTSATEVTCTLDTTYASTGRSAVKCYKNGGVCTITFMPLVLKAQSGRHTFGTVPEGFRPVGGEYYIHPNGWASENYLIVGTDGTLKAHVNLPSENESWASGTYVIGG